MLLAGAGICGRRTAPEAQIIAGWGALCVGLTLWGVFVPLSLTLPAAVFIAAALAALLTARRPGIEEWRALGRVLVLSLPLWLVLAPIRPSQPDTFLNLLPNAFYLVDYASLPSAAGPPSHSLLPGAPYNTQFLSYLGSFLTAGYPASGMSLVNLMLQLAAALAIARVLAGEAATAPSWGMTALGILLVTLLNPGFVPRIDLAPYGEPALAVTALFAVLGFANRGSPVALALTLAAMVNTKQSGLGLVTAVAGAALVTAWAEAAEPRVRALAQIALAVAPAVLLFLVWRYYVAQSGLAELRLLPLTEWNWPALPAAATGAAAAVVEKPTYFGCVAAAFAALGVLWRRDGWTPATRVLAIHAVLFLLYTGFVMLTYVGHFSAEMARDAHSFFRYSTHLSLVLVLALALAARDLGLGAWVARNAARPAAAAAIALILLAPVGFIKRLRFDLDMPQPLVWNIAKMAGPHLHDGDRLALVLPGDNGSVAAMLAGVLRYTPPRRANLDTTDAPSLDVAAARGYSLALVSCTPEGRAALMRRDADGWREVAGWAYPEDAQQRRWQHFLSWAPLCRLS